MTPSDTTPQGAEPREDGWRTINGIPDGEHVEVRERDGSVTPMIVGSIQWKTMLRDLGQNVAVRRPAPAAPTNGGGGLELAADLRRRSEACRDLIIPGTTLANQWRLEGKQQAYAHAAELAALQPQPTQQGGAEALAKAIFDDDFRELPGMTWAKAGQAHQAVYIAQADRILAALNTSEARG